MLWFGECSYAFLGQMYEYIYIYTYTYADTYGGQSYDSHHGSCDLK